MFKSDCPQQQAFIRQLDEILCLYYESMKDRFSVHDQDKYIEEFSQKKKHFVNSWCPTYKEYEGCKYE